MGIKLEEFLSKLPLDEQVAIQKRGGELIAEEANLRGLRKARRRSQQQLATQLGVGQAAVSRLERRTDMYISTLRSLLQAMGGDLEIIARFPDRAPLRITQFKGIKAEGMNAVLADADLAKSFGRHG
jgi:transcriptional regulator with XRE-family HTH domain